MSEHEIAAAIFQGGGAVHLDAIERVRHLIDRAKVEALHEAADRMPAFHDRDVPEWAITSACKWLRDRARALLDAAPAGGAEDALGQPCRQCGPGYRIGDDGCRHGAAASGAHLHAPSEVPHD